MRLSQNVGCLFSCALWLAVDAQQRLVCLAKRRERERETEKRVYFTRHETHWRSWQGSFLFFFVYYKVRVGGKLYKRAPPPETWRVSHFCNIVFYSFMQTYDVKHESQAHLCQFISCISDIIFIQIRF
jgi:hypothetical protein